MYSSHAGSKYIINEVISEVTSDQCFLLAPDTALQHIHKMVMHG